jgi:hypothetical protein
MKGPWELSQEALAVLAKASAARSLEKVCA